MCPKWSFLGHFDPLRGSHLSSRRLSPWVLSKSAHFGTPSGVQIVAGSPGGSRGSRRWHRRATWPPPRAIWGWPWHGGHAWTAARMAPALAPCTVGPPLPQGRARPWPASDPTIDPFLIHSRPLAVGAGGGGRRRWGVTRARGRARARPCASVSALGRLGACIGFPHAAPTAAGQSRIGPPCSTRPPRWPPRWLHGNPALGTGGRMGNPALDNGSCTVAGPILTVIHR